MFFRKNKSSFIKGMALGILAGSAMSAAAMVACDKDRMKCVKKLMKNGWCTVTKNL